MKPPLLRIVGRGAVLLAVAIVLPSECLAQAEQKGKVHRRIIVNDDGEVVLPGEGKSWDDYLGERLTDAVGTQVDSYFLNIGATDRGPGIVNSLQSSMAYWASEKETPAVYAEATRRYIDAARKAKMEIFASIRLNDVHDSYQAGAAGAAGLNYPLKVQRPDLLMGSPESLKAGRSAYPNDSVMAWFWSGLDWAEADVRQHFLDFIADYCRQYDFDGLELDYFRHPLFFKPGEEEQNLDAMTEFVRQASKILREIGEARRRPYLLAIRVPDNVTFARRTGLDVPRWLKEDLVDLLVVGGGYMPYSGRLKELTDLAHQHGVPAYPCVNHFRGPLQMQTIASNFWALGGDGFYLFNYYGVTGEEVNKGWGASAAESLHQIGSVETLRGLDKLYLPDERTSIAYVGYSNTPGQLPVRLIDGTPVELVVGDDVQQAQSQQRLAELRLELKVADMANMEGITIQVNGTSVASENIKRLDETTFAAQLAAPPLRRGINQLVFLPGLGSAGRMTSQVTGIQLSLRYSGPH